MQPADRCRQSGLQVRVAPSARPKFRTPVEIKVISTFGETNVPSTIGETQVPRIIVEAKVPSAFGETKFPSTIGKTKHHAPLRCWTKIGPRRSRRMKGAGMQQLP